MEERKLIRRRAMKQKRGVFYRKSAATTAALVSTVNILPVSVLADTLESTEAQNGVRVVETADSSQDHSTQDHSTQDSVIVVEDNATNAESGTQDNSDSSNVDVVGVPESEDVPERAPADDTASEQKETEIGSDIPVLSEEERIAIETKVMPNYNNPMARSTNQQAFIQQVGPMAQEVAGANDLYASVMIAQAILESGWGQSTLTTLANNMFGIKGSYNGQFVEMQTMEDDGNGNLYPIIAKFRKYPSLKESFQDNAHVLKTTSFSPGVFFYHGAWKSNTNSYRDATQWLQGRYATDTSYASKLNNLIETYNLTQYDTSSGGGSNNNNNNNNSEQAINKQFRTNAALNIRSDASTSASIVGSLAANATFQAVAQKSGTSVNGNTSWYRIQGRGWVSAAHVTEISSDTGGNGNNNNGNNNNTEQSINKEFRTTAALNIRSDASTSASVVGSLANNTTFRAVAQKTGTSVNGNNVWYRIQGRGWVSAAYVSEVSSGSNNTEQSINKEFRTTATLNIRSDASTSANIVSSLSNNASFRAVAQKTGTSVNGNNIWYRIEGRGWVSAAYVREHNTSSSSTTHTVRSGDTLWGISQRYGVTVNQLMQWNNLSGSLIVVGQRLVVSR
ncbi:glucosaminidase domain-containing protein [Enterococcus casseliflavus]|uniref:glucosaminidase domain-containing protein n=1 Tax=Enterococcus casseliflavus TaxID=37734 RepID=UPI0022E059FE|nr:glucosaminidase domain-containing protein [Enterococcus casseliflavus]